MIRQSLMLVEIGIGNCHHLQYSIRDFRPATMIRGSGLTEIPCNILRAVKQLNTPCCFVLTAKTEYHHSNFAICHIVYVYVERIIKGRKQKIQKPILLVFLATCHFRFPDKLTEPVNVI